MSALPFPTSPRPASRPRHAQRPSLRLVTPPRRTTRYFALLIACTAVGVFGVVTLNALAAESAFSAQQLEADVERLAIRYDELTAEVAALESPARVRAVAIDELGMIGAEQPAYLVLGAGSDEVTSEAPESRPDNAADAALSDPVKPALGMGR